MKTIADIQRRLIALGFSVGKSGVDGVMGTATETATRLAALAFGLGMTIKQFKDLSPEKQEEVRRAYWTLVSPPRAARPATPSSGLPRARERVSER